MTRPPPNPFGPFQIIRTVGHGGMATVFEADDTRLGCRVALKVSDADPDDAAATERFHREARFAQRLHHPFICPVYESGEVGGRHYLTMPLLDGVPLDKRTGLAHPWPERDAVELARRLAVALQAVHDAGVIHRDLKPHNVMLRGSGEPVLMDFGLARDRTGKEGRLTATGTALGTLAYIPPEQARGNPDAIGPPTDVYALGVLLYLLLTGRLPFDGGNPVVLYQRILNDPPTRPSDFRPGLPSRIEAVTLKALAKAPADRFPTMTAFAAALAECRPPSDSRPGTVVMTPPPTDFPKSNPSAEVVDAPGTWTARPAGGTGDWLKFAVTPGRLPAKPGFVLRFAADRGATDAQLAGLAGLAARTDIDGVDLTRCDVATPVALTAVGKLSHLRFLACSRPGGGVPLTDAGLAALAGLTKLETFEASLTDVSDVGLAPLAGFAALTRADLLDGGKISDAGVAVVGRLATLTFLRLGGCGLTDLGMRHLGGLTRLAGFALTDCHRLTGAGFVFLAKLPALRSVTLSGGREIGDETLASVTGLPKLAALELRNLPRLTASGLAHLAGAQSLRSLTVANCRTLTDDALGRVAAVPWLETLDVVGCDRVTAAGVDRLKKASPGCRVTWRPAEPRG